MFTSFRSHFEFTQRSSMLLFILLNPPFVNLVDWHRIEIVQFLASSPHRCNEVGCFKTREVLRNGLSGHVEIPAEFSQSLAVVRMQLV